MEMAQGTVTQVMTLQSGLKVQKMKSATLELTGTETQNILKILFQSFFSLEFVHGVKRTNGSDRKNFKRQAI